MDSIDCRYWRMFVLERKECKQIFYKIFPPISPNLTFLGKRELRKAFKTKAFRSFWMCKDYKKDIFGRFAYDFELSQNILSFLI